MEGKIMSADLKKDDKKEIKDDDVLIFGNSNDKCGFCGSAKTIGVGFGAEAKCPRGCGSSLSGFNSTYHR